AYVLYGLSQARAEGYDVSDEMTSRGREAAAQMLKSKAVAIPAWQRSNHENTRAFLLYALALSRPNAEQIKLIATARDGLFTQKLEAQALGYVVLLDKLLGRTDSAWPEMESQLVPEGDQLLHWKGSGRDEWSDWNDKTATALGLQALVAQNPRDRRIEPVLLWLMTHRQDETWGSTRDTAWILAALCTYLDSRPAVAPQTSPASVRVILNGKTMENLPIKANDSSGEMVLRVPWPRVSATRNRLSIARNGGAEPLFYAVQVRQTVASDGPLPALASTMPIQVTREYRRIVPRAVGSTNSWTLHSEATSNQLKAGDRVRVRLTFQVPSDLSYVLIEDAFPSGCEVTERGEAGEGSEDWDNWWSSTDVRDDRIAFFARRMSRGKHTVEYNLRAQTPGTFAALPTLLQAMYAPDVRAESAEDRVVIE
ncbi:MAG TPA: hypothetical protein VF627_11485, partial [Abditibacterium sp.]